MKKHYDERSFDELYATYELMQLNYETRKSREQKPEVSDKISLLQKEIKFERLKRARREYEASGKLQSEWPVALQGKNLCEWEISTCKTLGLEIPLHLKVSCKEFIAELEREMDTKTVALNEI